MHIFHGKHKDDLPTNQATVSSRLMKVCPTLLPLNFTHTHAKGQEKPFQSKHEEKMPQGVSNFCETNRGYANSTTRTEDYTTPPNNEESH